MRPRSTPSRLLRAFMFVCVITLSAYAQSRSTEFTMKDNPLLANLRPWCIGRLVFDRPAGSEMHYEKYRYAGNDIAIRPNVSPQAFQRMVEAREKELRTKMKTESIGYKEMLSRGLKSMDIETTTPWLEQAAAPSSHSRIFIFKKNANGVTDLVSGEGYILAGTNQLTLTTLFRREGTKKVIADDSEWYRATTYRDDWAVPTERGFCIKGALIGGPSSNVGFVDQTFLLMPGRPATFVIQMTPGIPQDQDNSLLKTVPDLKRRLDTAGLFSKVRVLREGKREFAGMQAEEVLLAMADNGVQTFRFYLRSTGNPESTAQPTTEIQLLLGAEPRDDFPATQATSPVDETGALQTWDTLLNSFRLRPGAM